MPGQDTALQVCASCQNGNHGHDTYTATGNDAGCPKLVDPVNLSTKCQCRVALPSKGPRPHCKTCRCGA